MRWLVSVDGQVSGPMDEAMVRTLVLAGHIPPDGMLREENGVGWVPLRSTPFARLGATIAPPTTDALPMNSPNVTLVQALVVVGIGAFAITAYVTCGNHSSSSNNSPVPLAPATPDPSEAWAASQISVKRELKAPSSADFGGWREHQDPKEQCTLLADGAWRCIGFVDSQNSFGAKLRANFAVTVKRSVDGSWTAISGPTLYER